MLCYPPGLLRCPAGADGVESFVDRCIRELVQMPDAVVKKIRFRSPGVIAAIRSASSAAGALVENQGEL